MVVELRFKPMPACFFLGLYSYLRRFELHCLVGGSPFCCISGPKEAFVELNLTQMKAGAG